MTALVTHPYHYANKNRTLTAGSDDGSVASASFGSHANIAERAAVRTYRCNIRYISAIEPNTRILSDFLR